MKHHEISTELNLWSFPRGPFVDLSDILTEMEATSRCLGVNAAPDLAVMLVQLDSEMDSSLEALYQFLQFYAKSYPKALEKALLQELRPTGPPTLVEILGVTGNPDVVTQLREVLAIDEADDELLLSLACALGELGGGEARQMLYQLRRRSNLSQPVQHEIKIALGNIAKQERATRMGFSIDAVPLQRQVLANDGGIRLVAAH